MILKHTDSAVRLTGRWDITNGDKAVTTAPGAVIEIAYKGKEAVLLFDTDMNADPMPHLWITVDNGAKTEVSLDRFIRIEAPSADEHLIKIIFKSAMEMQHRWYPPLTGYVAFLGVEAAQAGKLPEDNRKIIQFIGDSITEGVLIDAFRNPRRIDQKNRVYQDDSTATYAYLTAESLNMRPVIMGYGAVGITKGGCGAVPKAIEAYPYNFFGSPIEPVDAAVTVINHGANDQGAKTEDYIKGYREFLKVVRKHNPNTKIVVLSAFCGAHHEELGKMIYEYNKENNENIAFVDSTGWVPKERLHPLREGHKIIAENLIQKLKDL